ncbi:MAG: PEP-utilizing enzyme [Dehalococcoidales bacterium]|nr:PEP-utilizing enzyme [Dehalococcoidales bacterium]
MAKGKEIIRGVVGNHGIVVAVVRIVGKNDVAKMATLKKGEVWVTERFDDVCYDTYLEQVSALVTNRGGTTSHGATQAKVVGIPAIAGTVEATSVLKEGQIVVVDGKAGIDPDTGKFYGAVYEHIPDQPAPTPAQLTLAERIATMQTKVAAQQGKPIPQELLDKQKKLA